MTNWNYKEGRGDYYIAQGLRERLLNTGPAKKGGEASREGKPLSSGGASCTGKCRKGAPDMACPLHGKGGIG